jgi:hypothetical protein
LGVSVATEGFHGRLDLAKRKREIIPALLMKAPLREDELHIPLQLQFNDREPMIVSFHEYYRFLDRLVVTALRQEVVRLVLVRVKMPAVIPLPRSLLDARVAIFYDVNAESRELIARGVEHLCVDANFKLYSWSAGDNSFLIRWVSPSGRRLGEAALKEIHDILETLPATFTHFADAGND